MNRNVPDVYTVCKEETQVDSLIITIRTVLGRHPQTQKDHPQSDSGKDYLRLCTEEKSPKPQKLTSKMKELKRPSQEVFV